MTGYDSFCCFRSPQSRLTKRVLWELNTACNLECSYCHTRTERSLHGLSLEKIIQFYDFLKERQITDIIFSGGEPFLRTDIFSILESAHQRGFSIDLCSNGTLIDGDSAARLRETLSEISISLDSHLSDIHDNWRGPGSHQMAITGVRHLVAAGLEVHAISVVTEESFSSMEETAELVAGLGVHSMTFLGRMATVGMSPAFPSRINQARLKERIFSIRETLDIPVNSKRLFFSPAHFPCTAGESMFGIDAEGNFLPCILFKGDHYNMAESPAWKKAFTRYRDRVCRPCEHLSKCHGGCPGASYLEDRTVRVDPLCITAYPGSIKD